MDHFIQSSRPLPGVLISLLVMIKFRKSDIRFSSPSRGSYISTDIMIEKRIAISSSRPLPGVLISLQDFFKAIQYQFESSRPLPGVLISLLIL